MQPSSQLSFLIIPHEALLIIGKRGDIGSNIKKVRRAKSLSLPVRCTILRTEQEIRYYLQLYLGVGHEDVFEAFLLDSFVT